MSGLTRSGVLLIAFGLLVDFIWRSVWTHLLRLTRKIIITALLAVIYSAIAATLILREHEAALVAFKSYVHGENFLRVVIFSLGLISALALVKLSPMAKGYLQSRRAEKLQVRLKAQKGWLDYRLESEKSSQQFHVLASRTIVEFKRMASGLRYVAWILKRESPSVSRVNIGAYLIARAINAPCKRMERHLEELSPIADLFVETTEGHLKSCRQNYERLAEAHEYFESQLKALRDAANGLTKVLPELKPYYGVSQGLTAAIDKLSSVLHLFTGTLRRVEGHCARMAKLAESRRDREIVKPLKKLASTLVETAEMMTKDTNDEGVKEQVRHLRRLTRSAGIKDKTS